MLSRLTRIQLVIFAVITGLTLSIMALNYVKIPQQLGAGRYEVTVELDDAGGLYPKAGVTYRGVEVGQVDRLEVGEDGGAVAILQIEDDADIPADSDVLVRSASVIGEQYVNFVPPLQTAPEAAASPDKVLREGAVVPAERTDLPTTTDEVLTSADDLVTSIPLDDLTNVLDEVAVAFGDSGDELGMLLSSTASFVDEANSNADQTVQLINDLGPVLQTQKDMDPALRSAVDSLDSVTAALARNDDDLALLFQDSGPFLKDIATFADDFRPGFSTILNDLGDTGAVLDAYDPAVQHILALAPALQQMFVAAMPVSRRDEEFPSINLDLRTGFTTPVCTQGFPSANKFRDPGDKTVLPVPNDVYCKPDDESLVVRGARNSPCPNNGNRGPYAFQCGLVFNPAEVERTKAAIAKGDAPNPDNGGSIEGASQSSGGPSFIDGTTATIRDMLAGMDAAR